MVLKYLVVTKYPQQLDSKLKKVREMMMLSDDVENVIFNVKKVSLGMPETYIDDEGKKRITERWFEQNISSSARKNGYDGAVFVFSMRDGRRWKVESALRGSTFRDEDGFGEMWVRGDRDSIIRYKNGRTHDRITKVIAHELGHDMKHRGFTDLEIHDFDYKDVVDNIEGFWLAFRVETGQRFSLKQMLMNLKRAFQIVQ